MSIATELALLANTKENLRVSLGLSKDVPFSQYVLSTPFTPRHLFINGEQGAWYDPSDLSTLFQDAEGTIPVTDHGDPVGLMLDKSGNGLSVSQSVAARRPIYREDGGFSCLEFDGVDDCLVRGDTPSLRQAVMDFGVAVMSMTTRRQDFISCGNTLTYPTLNWLIQVNGSNVNLLPRSPASTQRFGAFTVGDPFVISASSDGENVSGRVNMGEDYTSTGFLGTDSEYGLAIGASNRHSIAYHLNGRIYGIILTGQSNLAPSLRLSMERYLVAKSGVTL